MGGAVDVTSEVGKGTTFKFSIRVERYKGPARIRSTSLEELSRKSTGYLAPTFKPKILLVDDNDINRKVMSKQLTKEGFITEEAINGLDALTKATSFSYALILMDVEMPIMDGPTAVTKIREMEMESGRSSVPIVVVTGNARAEQIESYSKLGIQSILTKPYTREKLLDTVVELVGATSSEFFSAP
ncbi:hypothetical protein HDU76_008192 [Blyttiomyces sp. JEL0837]|nr:hypothetical protein HDU76_008192 [Blyttiomyces sp. JEL0837]